MGGEFTLCCCSITLHQSSQRQRSEKKPKTTTQCFWAFSNRSTLFAAYRKCQHAHFESSFNPHTHMVHAKSIYNRETSLHSNFVYCKNIKFTFFLPFFSLFTHYIWRSIEPMLSGFSATHRSGMQASWVKIIQNALK